MMKRKVFTCLSNNTNFTAVLMDDWQAKQAEVKQAEE
jgi:hypothetical protein